MDDAAKSSWRPALRFVGMHALDAQFLWLEDAYVPIAQGARIGCAVLSYAGQLCFGITADLQSVGDLDPFTRAIERDLHDLLARARAQLPAAEIQP